MKLADFIPLDRKHSESRLLMVESVDYTYVSKYSPEFSVVATLVQHDFMEDDHEDSFTELIGSGHVWLCQCHPDSDALDEEETYVTDGTLPVHAIMLSENHDMISGTVTYKVGVIPDYQQSEIIYDSSGKLIRIIRFDDQEFMKDC